jgi:hypothetical protein
MFQLCRILSNQICLLFEAPRLGVMSGTQVLRKSNTVPKILRKFSPKQLPLSPVATSPLGNRFPLWHTERAFGDGAVKLWQAAKQAATGQALDI